MSRGIRPTRVTITRYELRGQRVPKGTPGAKRKVTRSDTWYANLPTGRVSLETTDEAEAWARLRKLQAEGRERAAGIRDRYTDAAERPIADHLAEWLQSVADSGATDKHVRELRMHVQAVIDQAGWKRITDLDPNDALSAVAAIVRQRDFSPQTRNHYVNHVQQFSRWLWTSKRLRDHPLIGLRPVSIDTDRRHQRRIPSDDEMAQLFGYLETAPPRWKLTAMERAMGYRLAMGAGLRASEVASLERGSFDLGDSPTVTVRGRSSKRRRTDRLPLPDWLAEELIAWFATTDRWPWHGIPVPGRLLEADLAHAGIARSVHGPDGLLYFDFHSLRHWYVTQLANQPGISPKVLMELARHSSSSLTLQTYAKPRIADMQAAADLVPRPTPATKPKRNRRKSR